MRTRATAAWLWAGMIAAVIIATSSPVAAAERVVRGNWVGSWSSAPTEPMFPVSRTAYQTNPGITRQTVREAVQITLGGDRLRVRLSNAHGSTPLEIGAASVGLAVGDGAAVQAGSLRRLTFGGEPKTTIPPGAFVLSDPVELSAPDFSRLAISVYAPNATGALTWHYIENTPTPTHFSPPGDFTGEARMPVRASSAPGSYGLLLSGVDVEAPQDAAAIVVIGDSISDGGRSEGGVGESWPSHLARRALSNPRGARLTVLNQAIAGNALLADLVGSNGLARFDRDVVAQPGAKFVIAALAINDLIEPSWLNRASLEASAEQVIVGLRQLVDRSHSAGLKIYGGTVTPGIPGLHQSPDWTAATEAKRQVINRWIRTSGAFDGVIDFDDAVRDPAQPDRLRPEYADPRLSVHTNPAGAKAMADAIDLALFR
jgi:lysophospholipase L1-like esterase